MQDASVANSQELFHYTGIGGVQGILENKWIRATHARYLNDSAEIKAFLELLPDLLRPSIEAEIRDKQLDPSLMGERFQSCLTSAEEFLLGTEQSGAGWELYVASFCVHEDPNVRRHGLLSQWRGYGKEGGYALVLDPAGVDALIVEENKKGLNCFKTRVNYSADPLVADARHDEATAKDLAEMDRGARLFAIGNENMGKYALREPLMRHACRYKHWGFKEESEVRIITGIRTVDAIIPPAERAHNRILLKQNKNPMGMRSRFFDTRSGTSVPYIKLFDEIGKALGNDFPITRIIVGPHPRAEERRRAVELMTQQYAIPRISVETSSIPFVGHS